MEAFPPYTKFGDYYYSVPESIWKGLQLPSGPEWKPAPEPMIKCIMTKIGSKVGKVYPSGSAFTIDSLRISEVPYDFSINFFGVEKVIGVHVLKPRGVEFEQSWLEVSPWENYSGQARIDRIAAYAQQYGVELPENWSTRENIRATRSRLRRHYEQTVVNPTYATVTSKIFDALRACVHEPIYAMAVGAEKGLPPLALEKYLGVPEPEKGSAEMKAYYKEHAARAAKAGRRKTRRPKKRRATQRK